MSIFFKEYTHGKPTWSKSWTLYISTFLYLLFRFFFTHKMTENVQLFLYVFDSNKQQKFQIDIITLNPVHLQRLASFRRSMLWPRLLRPTHILTFLFPIFDLISLFLFLISGGYSRRTVFLRGDDPVLTMDALRWRANPVTAVSWMRLKSCVVPLVSVRSSTMRPRHGLKAEKQSWCRMENLAPRQIGGRRAAVFSHVCVTWKCQAETERRQEREELCPSISWKTMCAVCKMLQVRMWTWAYI